MKITKTNLTNLIRDELENFKIVKLSKDDMEQLHKTGQIEKDGVFYQYQEPVKEFKIRKTNRLMNKRPQKTFPIRAEKEDEIEEKLKMSKGSGRGTSWMNYDDDTYRMQVTKDSNQYHISVFKKFMGPSSKRLLDLRGLSKTDAAKLVKIAKSTGLEKTAKYGKSKYKKYVSEGKKIQVATFKDNIKFQLDVEKEARNIIDALKVDKKKLTPKNISDYINAEYKFFKTPQLNLQVFKHIKKNLKNLSEGKRQQLSIPVTDKLKTDKILKKLRLKPGKDYDVGVGSRNSFILDVEGKHLDKIITLLMKQRIRVR